MLDDAAAARSDSIGHAVGTVLAAVWTGITASPVTVTFVLIVALMFAVRLTQAVAYPRRRRDPVRRFSRAEKAEILRRAGNRCERHGLITGRCRATDGLEGDHVIPWSRSGPTTVANGRALCRRHNRAKSATVPLPRQLRALARRRAAYYPVGVSGAVVRRRPPMHT